MLRRASTAKDVIGSVRALCERARGRAGTTREATTTTGDDGGFATTTTATARGGAREARATRTDERGTGRRAERAGEALRAGRGTFATWTTAGRRAFATATGSEREGERDDDGEDGDGNVDGDSKTNKHETAHKLIDIPDEVPHDPPLLRSTLVKRRLDVTLACAETVSEAIKIATDSVADGDYPTSSRQVRIMITKIKTKEDIREVFAFMAKMHRIRLAKYEPVATDTPEEAANRSQWGGHMVWREQVALELFNEIRKFDDHEAAVEMVENHASLGVKLTRTVAKQAFFNTYTGPFEYVYRVYEAVRESYGTEDFTMATMIGASLDNRHMDLAREYAVAFKESGAVVPSRTYFKFLKWATRIGEPEHALWANEEHIASIRATLQSRIERMERINAAIEAGTHTHRGAEKLEIPAKWREPDVMPITPFYYVHVVRAHLLNRDVASATRMLDSIPSFEHTTRKQLRTDIHDNTRGFELKTYNVQDQIVAVLADWPRKLYIEENFNGEPSRDELRESMKAAIDGVARDDIKAAFASMDVDAIFDALDGDAQGDSLATEDDQAEEASTSAS